MHLDILEYLYFKKKTQKQQKIFYDMPFSAVKRVSRRMRTTSKQTGPRMLVEK